MRTKSLIFDRYFAMEKWNISEEELPEVLIIQGQRITSPHLHFVETEVMTDSRRLIMGDVIHGKYKEKHILFASGFGAAILADITHFAALLGIKYVLVLGTIGGLAPSLNPYDILIPTTAVKEDGISHWYVEASTLLHSSSDLNTVLETMLQQQGLTCSKGTIISVPSMLCETRELINFWSHSNIHGVDLETSAIFAVAHKFGIPYSGMLFVIDNLIQNHDITQLTNKDRENSTDFMKKLITTGFEAIYTMLE